MTDRILSSSKRTRVATRAADIASVRKYSTNSKAQAALVDPNKPLTDMQKAFVSYWAEGDSIPNSFLRAGYDAHPSYAYRMICMPNIKRAYDKVKRKFEEAAQIKRVDVMNGLKESIDMAKLMSEPATMIAGWREIGRLCGYYEPRKVEVNLNVSGSVMLKQMAGMSDAELLKIIEQGVASESEALLIEDEDGGE